MREMSVEQHFTKTFDVDFSFNLSNIFFYRKKSVYLMERSSTSSLLQVKILNIFTSNSTSTGGKM